jgi:hypothetical protein
VVVWRPDGATTATVTITPRSGTKPDRAVIDRVLAGVRGGTDAEWAALAEAVR